MDDHKQGLLPRLADGELDRAVVNEHPVLPETASTAMGRAYLFDDAFQVVLPRQHRLARSGAGLDLPDLAGEAWVGGAWFRIVRHACRTAGFDPASRCPPTATAPSRPSSPRAWA